MARLQFGFTYAIGPLLLVGGVGVVNADNPYLANILAVGLTPERARAIWIERTVTTYGQWLGNGNADSITGALATALTGRDGNFWKAVQ